MPYGQLRCHRGARCLSTSRTHTQHAIREQIHAADRQLNWTASQTLSNPNFLRSKFGFRRYLTPLSHTYRATNRRGTEQKGFSFPVHKSKLDVLFSHLKASWHMWKSMGMCLRTREITVS